MNTILILMGPPASGKDTISKELSNCCSKYELLRKYRAAKIDFEPPMNIYMNVPVEIYKSMESDCLFIHSHKKYGNYYGISTQQIQDLFAQDKVPIIHFATLNDIYDFENALAERFIDILIYKVLLWNEQKILQERVYKRNSNSHLRVRKMNSIHKELFQLKSIEISSAFSLVIKNDDKTVTTKLIIHLIETSHSNSKHDLNNLHNYLSTL